MKNSRRKFFTIGLAVLCTVFFSYVGIASALEIVLEPDNAQREAGSDVRVQIYANNAVDLISMGVKVSFDPTILEVVSASKYENFDNGWIMDADGDPTPPPPPAPNDQYTSPAVEIDNIGGSVTMIGGRLIGSDTNGLNGKVLLGWIVFRARTNGTSSLTVDRAKYNTEPDTFDNFVQLDGTVSEPTNLPSDLGAVCVYDNACSADLNNDGYVNIKDFGMLKSNFLTNCNNPAPEDECVGDIDGDGFINITDFGILKSQFFQPGCTVCD